MYHQKHIAQNDDLTVVSVVNNIYFYSIYCPPYKYLHDWLRGLGLTVLVGSVSSVVSYYPHPDQHYSNLQQNINAFQI